MTYQALWQSLTDQYDESEAKDITRLVLESRFGLTLTDIALGKVEQLEPADEQLLRDLFAGLRDGQPVQYVLGEAWFYGRRFHVEPGVLIPRPETEELCHLVLAGLPSTWKGTILDIGSGSGCIAVTLAAERELASVTAWDLSPHALAVAQGNAKLIGVANDHSLQQPLKGVVFRQVDALNAPADEEQWDIIVSNPPYVCEQEKALMRKNVLDFEPPEALFVPDEDPLRFYRAIGRYATKALKAGGQLFFELNERLANETKELLADMGLANIIIYKDQYGKDRFISACK